MSLILQKSGCTALHSAHRCREHSWIQHIVIGLEGSQLLSQTPATSLFCLPDTLTFHTYTVSSMSLILSTAGPLKPEIRLAQAVSQFEASLSDGQKVAFRNQRTQSLQSPPSTRDVMRMTAEIDASQKAGGRCFGPRFTKFLHGAQQFAALGDVLVGGSQNLVACGVWSVVRMCLLVLPLIVGLLQI